MSISWVFVDLWGWEGVAWSRLTLILLVMPFYYHGLCRTLDMRARHVIEQLWRPAVASLCMAAAITWFRADFVGLSTAVELLVRMFAGAAVFIATLTLAWLLAGRPDGVERDFLTHAGSYGKTLLRSRGWLYPRLG